MLLSQKEYWCMPKVIIINTFQQVDKLGVLELKNPNMLKWCPMDFKMSLCKYLIVSDVLSSIWKWSGFWFSSLRQILSSFLVSYFSKICSTFHPEQLLIRFLTITFDFYWSLALQLLCITVKLSDSIFLFPLASN